MHIRDLQLALLVVLAGCASSSPLLSSLSAQLQQLRSLPANSPTNARCPADTTSLVGLRHFQVKEALGSPDFVDKPGSTWSYFFTSPQPPGQLGGGHPELSFAFGPTQRVVDVTCHYAR
jgi:hypothetical protein